MVEVDLSGEAYTARRRSSGHEIGSTTVRRCRAPQPVLTRYTLREIERPWFVSLVPPTHKKVAVDMVVVVQLRGEKRARERIDWDHAAVLRHVGLLPASDAAHPRQEGPHADARSRRTGLRHPAEGATGVARHGPGRA